MTHEEIVTGHVAGAVLPVLLDAAVSGNGSRPAHGGDVTGNQRAHSSTAEAVAQLWCELP